MVAVRFVKIAARRVINLTSPRFEPSVSLNWKGKRDWHDPFYEPLRDVMERVYVDGFNTANGHYHRLEADILANGITNPVMLVSGKLQRRRLDELPPQYRYRASVLVSEYLGGSRLYVAQKHALDVPAIINDFGGLFADAPRLSSVDEIEQCFAARPRIIEYSEVSGAHVNDMVYSHMPAGYSLAAQIPIRAKIVHLVKVAVAEWLAQNDRA